MMSEQKYRPVAGTGYPRVVRPNSVRYVNPINELNRLLDRIAELEAACASCYDAQQRASEEVMQLQAKLEAVERVIADLDTQCTNGHAVKALRKALQEQGDE
jgi:chromosome segregation ATPase